MKWREPWINTLIRQGTFNPFTKREFKAGLIWAGTLLAVGLVSTFAKDGTTGHVAETAPIIILLGFGIAFFISFANWASPVTVSSGPRGIVKSKGDTYTLIPWAAVTHHRFLVSKEGRVLELLVSYQTEPELLYLAAHVNPEQVSAEIKKMTDFNG